MRVAFFGHRDVILGESERVFLGETVEGLIAEGATEFLLGGYGNFDREALSVVREAKRRHPKIRAVLVTAYIDRELDRTLYDESVYPPLENVPRRYAILRRNEWIVKEADVLIFGVKRKAGGAAKALALARRSGKRVISLFAMRETEKREK